MILDNLENRNFDDLIFGNLIAQKQHRRYSLHPPPQPLQSVFISDLKYSNVLHDTALTRCLHFVFIYSYFSLE